MPGKGYIKFTSVLLIISAVLAVIIYPIAGLLLEYATVDTGEEMGWLFVVICLLYTVAAILQLIAGVKGVQGCDDKAAASDLKKWGEIVLVIAAIAGIVNFVSYIIGHQSVLPSILAVLLGLVFPAIYIYGASLNERA